jgi:hypothetical protein
LAFGVSTVGTSTSKCSTHVFNLKSVERAFLFITDFCCAIYVCRYIQTYICTYIQKIYIYVLVKLWTAASIPTSSIHLLIFLLYWVYVNMFCSSLSNPIIVRGNWKTYSLLCILWNILLYFYIQMTYTYVCTCVGLNKVQMLIMRLYDAGSHVCLTQHMPFMTYL